MALLGSLVYDRLQTFIYGDYAVATGFFAEQFRKAGMQAGDDVVEIGCGTGLLSTSFTALGARYTGLDMEAERIETAKKRNPGAKFICGNLLEPATLSQLKFRFTIMHAVIHHLSDSEFAGLLSILKTNGCQVLCTMDPVRPAKGSRPLARLMCDLDDGKFVREEPDYKRLFPAETRLQAYVHKYPRWPADILYMAAEL